MTVLNYLVQLDPRLQEFIALAITAVVSFLILQVYRVNPWLGEYLGQHKVGITVWLTGLVVQIIQERLDQVPATWDSVLSLAMQLIVEALIVIVGLAFWRKQNLKGSQALM